MRGLIRRENWPFPHSAALHGGLRVATNCPKCRRPDGWSHSANRHIPALRCAAWRATNHPVARMIGPSGRMRGLIRWANRPFPHSAAPHGGLRVATNCPKCRRPDGWSHLANRHIPAFRCASWRATNHVRKPIMKHSISQAVPATES